MMTIDDEGEGTVWPNDDVITEIQFLLQIFGISPGILLKFSPKCSNSEKKFLSKFEVQPNCV